MAISYDKKIMECVLRSVMSEGNVAQGKAIKSICKSPKPLFITGRAGTGKSFLLKTIADVFIYISKAQIYKRKPKFKYPKFS